jgi:hypothetical protein
MGRMHNTEAIHIAETPGLDPIMVYFTNFEPGKGMVTLVCFGNAWSAYFGGMGTGEGEGIREFFLGAGTSYLVNKLGISQVLKQAKHYGKYLGRVIDAVKAELGQGAGLGA